MDHIHSAGCGCRDESKDEKFSLYRYVNVLGLQALNCVDPSKLKDVLRPESEKLEGLDVKFVESDDEDPEMILIIPFTGSVRLRKIVFVTAGETAPTEVKLFKNVEASFDTDVAPTQVLQLNEDAEGVLEYAVNAPKFNDVRVLSLFFPDSVGGETTRIHYIGLLGDHIPQQEKLKVNCLFSIFFPSEFLSQKGVVYESKPQLKDHETRADMTGNNNVGF